MTDFEQIRKALASATNDNKEQTRRRFPRRMKDVCVVAIGENTYPVHDWSQCGVLFEADGRTFEANQDCTATMKFRLSDVVTEISVQARVVRTNTKQVALEFTDLSKKIEKAFAKVIEDAINQAQSEEEQIG
jgi:hypothetical protein